MKNPSVSIVIVNYNGKNLLKTALDSINELKFKYSFETIVVDNNSNDGSIEFIKKNYKKVIIVKNGKNLGYSGVNSALKYCRGKYIFFLNNDIELDKYCLEKLYNNILEKDVAMAVPRLVNYYDNSIKSSGTWVSRSFYCGHIGNAKAELKEVPYLGVGLIRKDVVEKFGYIFDPDYFIYGEDLDLGLRMRVIGMKTIFVPDAIMLHIHSATMQKSSTSRKIFLMERNLIATFFKILSIKNIMLFMPYVIGLRLAASIKDILTLNFSNAFARIKALFWILFNFNPIIKKRNHIQKIRTANDNFILKVFTEKYIFRKPFVV